jgi:hypothetical protein
MNGPQRNQRNDLVFNEQGEGGWVTVELAEEFRTRAQRCLKLAQEAPTLEAQTHWLAMAQLWFSLAQHAEEQDAEFFTRNSAARANKDNGDESGHSNGDGEGEGR